MATSKIAQKKESQGYIKKGPTCGTCRHYTSDIAMKGNAYGYWTEEKNKRCSLGGFATGKGGWCRHHGTE